MKKPITQRVWVPFFTMMLMLVFIASCSKNPTSYSENTEEALAATSLAKGNNNNNSGETAYTTDSGIGTFAGYNETNCPDYGSYEYTLWAGKTNNAGSVLITNDDENIYVTYQTNETADLGEVHVYVWTSMDDIPDRRPAPGHAPYKAEDINADSYTVTIPMSINCGDIVYISTHAALVADATDDGITGEDSNAGETAYGGGTNADGGFTASGGAWWGYVTYMIECYYDISGTVYEDADNNADFGDESTFEGITVNLLDDSGALIASTQTAADGSYLFEHVAGGADYTVVVAEGPEGDYLANENASGFAITDLSECMTEVDFGFVPLYDLSGTVYNDANNNGDNDTEAGFEGITVVLTDAAGNVVATTTTDADGNYMFENQLPGDYTVSVTAGPEGYDATENAGGVSLSLTDDTTGIDFGFYQETTVTYDPCDTDRNGTVDDAEYAACNPGPTGDDFPVWGQSISHVILVFAGAPEGDNDGYYTVKIDEWPDGMDRDLDNSIDQILAFLIANDSNVTENSDLLGSSIKGGRQVTAFYAYGVHNLNGTASDTPPSGLAFNYPGGDANESPQNAIDTVYFYGPVMSW